MAARHFLKVTDEEINCIVSQKQRKCILILCKVRYIGFSTHEFNVFVDLDLLFREVEECFFRVTGPFPATSWPRDVSRAATNVFKVMRDGSCQPRELYGSLIEVFSKDGDLIIDIGSMQMVSSIITFSMTGRWFNYIVYMIPFSQSFSLSWGVGWGD